MKTITKERLEQLRRIARGDGLSPASSAELLDACAELLDEVERLRQRKCVHEMVRDFVESEFDG